jgi:hypothetical protein
MWFLSRVVGECVCGGVGQVGVGDREEGQGEHRGGDVPVPDVDRGG